MYVVNKHRPMVGQDISPNWPLSLTSNLVLGSRPDCDAHTNAKGQQASHDFGNSSLSKRIAGRISVITNADCKF